MALKRGYPSPSSPAARRKMLSNRRRDTTPELALRSALHRRGLRFRVDFPVSAGGRSVRPDIVFTRDRLAVYIDGCFWHGCPEHATQPKANAEYWGPKLRANIARDRRATAALEESGWTVLRVWEHVPVEDAVAAVVRTLQQCGYRHVERARARSSTPEAG
jgi:DNA mismatch endonuclease (patch repair protein)